MKIISLDVVGLSVRSFKSLWRMEMKNRIILLATLCISMNISAAQYSTDAIVRNVMDCMSELGGLNDVNMHTCSCRADYIISKMKFREYENALTWDRNKQMPAKKGETIRDNEIGKKASLKHEKVLTESEVKCPPGSQAYGTGPTLTHK